MTLYGHGWLPHNPNAPPIIEGHFIPLETRTRREEYAYVSEQASGVKGHYALDAATGCIEQWHKTAPIIATKGFKVEAFDIDPAVLERPDHLGVFWQRGDLRDIHYPANTFDLVVCVSTLEHLELPDLAPAAAELVRVAKPGATLILTADRGDWLPRVFSPHLAPGPAFEPEGDWSHCDPPVYWLTALKP